MMAATLERDIFEAQLWRCDVDQYQLMHDMGWFDKTRVELIEGLILRKNDVDEFGYPRPFQWTVNHYYQMAELGWFEGSRVELIEGEIISMSPMLSRHATAVTKTGDTLRLAFGAGFFVRTQLPLHLGFHSEPEPDVAMIAGVPGDFRDAHPMAAALVVEVSDSTLPGDRLRKANIYARAGLDEYWIVNLIDSQLEVHHAPVEMPDQPSGYGYADIKIFKPGEMVVPLAAPHTMIAVTDLLP